MKAAVKTAWVKDLRDNPDAQGQALLDYIDTDGNRRQCCLGRLCLLAVAAGVIPAPELHKKEYRYLDDNDAGGESFNQACSLPRKVAEWAGLPDKEDGQHADDVVIGPGLDEDGGTTAIGANDGLALSYAEIADLIEANVPAE